VLHSACKAVFLPRDSGNSPQCFKVKFDLGDGPVWQHHPSMGRACLNADFADAYQAFAQGLPETLHEGAQVLRRRILMSNLSDLSPTDTMMPRAVSGG